MEQMSPYSINEEQLEKMIENKCINIDSELKYIFGNNDTLGNKNESENFIDMAYENLQFNILKESLKREIKDAVRSAMKHEFDNFKRHYEMKTDIGKDVKSTTIINILEDQIKFLKEESQNKNKLLEILAQNCNKCKSCNWQETPVYESSFNDHRYGDIKSNDNENVENTPPLMNSSTNTEITESSISQLNLGDNVTIRKTKKNEDMFVELPNQLDLDNLF